METIQDSITMENDYLKTTISPSGAVVVNLYDKLRGREDVKILPHVGGVNDIRNFDSNKPGLRYKIVRDTTPDGGQKVTCVATMPGDEDAEPMVVVKEYVLPKDASHLRMTLEIRNEGEREIGEIPWVRHLLNRGLKEQPEEAHMTEYGSFLTGQPQPADPTIKSYGDLHYFPASGWTSRVILPVEDGSNTLATVLNPRDMLKIYNWHRGQEDFCTQEVIAAPMFVNPGESARWEYFVVVTAPVRNIVYCSPDLVIGVNPHPTWLTSDVKELTLSFASAKNLEGVSVYIDLFSLDEEESVAKSSFKLPALTPENTHNHSIPVNLKDKANYQLRLNFSSDGHPYYPGEALGDRDKVVIPLVVGRKEKPEVVYKKLDARECRLRRIQPRKLEADKVYSGDDLEVFEFPSSRRCFRQDTFEAAGEGTLHLHGCAGEYESLQLVLLPRKEGKISWEVSASDLTGPNGEKIQCEGVNGFIYVPTEIPSQYNATFPVGEYPEALVPVKEVALDGNGNLPLFITYHAPADAPPGVYQGAVTLSGRDTRHEIPVKMTVWNIRMPKRSQYMEVASSLKGDVLKEARHPDGTPYTRKEQLDAIVDMHLKYRLTPCDSGLANILLSGDYDAFEKEMRKFVEGGATKIFLGSIPQLLKKHGDQLPEIEKYLKSKEWFDYFYVRPGFDEASIDLVPQIRETCRQWKQVSSVPIMETYYHDERAEDLFGCLDIWCRGGMPAPDWFQQRVAAGDCFWKVNAMPSLLEVEPWRNARLRYVQYWDHHFTGTYLWTTKFWQGVKEWGKDYWSDGGVGNLCAVLMWPHETGILSTIRLEAMRDGLEDNALLWMLRQKFDSVKDHDGMSPAQKNAVQQAREICASGPLAPTITSVEDLDQLRLKAGSTLSDLNTLFPEKH